MCFRHVFTIGVYDTPGREKLLGDSVNLYKRNAKTYQNMLELHLICFYHVSTLGVYFISFLALFDRGRTKRKAAAAAV